MGGTSSTQQAVEAMEQPASDHMVVRADEMIAKRGSTLPVSGRYTCSRQLEQDYELQNRVLGTGMSGAVRLAKGRSDGRRYAVKSFEKSNLSPKNRQDLRNEAELYLQFDHPHIAQLNMVFETDDMLHLVMECMEGGELYERLATQRRYTESAAADAVYQMLLAIAYLHAHKIAHRDLKLENFLYESKGTSHLKLIDFGLAKIWDPSTRMSQACGSIHYVAPEVLSQSYTTQADMWSVGIIAYMLLVGSPAFSGSDSEILRKIKAGMPHFSSKFGKLSEPAQSFVRSLLQKDPLERLTAAQALEHPWIKGRHLTDNSSIDAGIVDSLRTFAEASRFRRAALSMMAWSLTTEEQAELREQFLLLDTRKSGSIKLGDLKAALKENFHVDGCEAEYLLSMLDSDNSEEIEYSEFLAAALVGRVNAHEGLLRRTFSRFDRDSSGLISAAELREVLGDSFEGSDMDELIRAVDTSGDGHIDFDEFMAYFQEAQPGSSERPARRRHTRKLATVIDKLLDSAEAEALQPMAGRSRTAPQELPTLLGLQKSMSISGQKA